MGCTCCLFAFYLFLCTQWSHYWHSRTQFLHQREVVKFMQITPATTVADFPRIRALLLSFRARMWLYCFVMQCCRVLQIVCRFVDLSSDHAVVTQWALWEIVRLLYGKFGAYFIVVKQDSVFLFVVKKKKARKKKCPLMLPAMRELPTILYLVRSSDFMLMKTRWLYWYGSMCFG